jgi:hypothetical protein
MPAERENQPDNEPDSLNENDQDQQDRGGRPPTLDEKKRRQIIAILACGCSRRVAARIVGCAHATITRTAQRDPEFGAQLDAAENAVQVEALRNIRNAAQNGRYWRASAWLLERKFPHDFAQQPHNAITAEDVASIILYMSYPFVKKLSDEEYDKYIERMYKIQCLVHERDDAAKLLNLPPPSLPRYVCRNGDGPDSRASENGTVPLDPADLDDPDDDYDEYPDSIGFAPQPPQTGRNADVPPSPQLNAAELFPTFPIPDAPVQQ